MSNINKNPILQDLSSEQAQAIQGGAAVELFQDDNFTRPLVVPRK